MPEIKLILFDKDGTLVSFKGEDPGDPRNRFESSWDAVGVAAGIGDKWFESRDRNYAIVTANPERVELYEKWCEEQTVFLRGIKVAYLLGQLMPIPYVPGIKEFLHTIKQNAIRGYKTGILTGGPNIVADKVREELGIDFSISTQLGVCDGEITGTLDYIVPMFGKGQIIREIAKEHNIKLEHIVAFGDHENDIPIFDMVGLPIAVCPKEEVKEVVTKSAKGNVIYDFMDAMPIIREYERI